MLIACRPDDLPRYAERLTARFVTISTCHASHSRKPPAGALLGELGVACGDGGDDGGGDGGGTLELFARYLLPSTIAIGDQALMFQDVACFVPKTGVDSHF